MKARVVSSTVMFRRPMAFSVRGGCSGGGGGAKEIKSKKRIILKPINTHCMVFNTIHSKTNDHE